MISEFNGEFAFLSNFTNSPIAYEGVIYPTVEHFFQAMKTLNPAERGAIAAAATPGIAKRMGRKVNLRPDWEKIKIDVMRTGLRLKFANYDMAQKLLATGDKHLIEGNAWHDNVWGSCNCPNCDNKPGRNLLGQLLMEIREEVRSRWEPMQ